MEKDTKEIVKTFQPRLTKLFEKQELVISRGAEIKLNESESEITVICPYEHHWRVKVIKIENGAVTLEIKDSFSKVYSSYRPTFLQYIFPMEDHAIIVSHQQPSLVMFQVGHNLQPFTGYEDLITLTYNSEIADYTFYLCKMSPSCNIFVVIISGTQCTQLMDILTYKCENQQVDMDYLTPRKNLSNRLPNNETVTDFFFNSIQSKILIATMENKFILYSLTENKFGPVLKWHNDIRYYKYVYNSRYGGDVLYILSTNGDMHIVYETNLSLCNHIQVDKIFYKDIYLVSHDRICANSLGRPLLMRFNSNKVHIYDLQKEKLIANLVLFQPIQDYRLIDIFTDRFGEEIFVVNRRDNILHVYYVKDEMTLVNLAKKKVFKSFSLDILHAMDLSNIVNKLLNIQFAK